MTTDSQAADWFDDAVSDAMRADMLRFARLQLRDADQAEDMVQEALLTAYRKRESFEGRSQIKTWLFSILRNRIIDWLRSEKRRFNTFDETPSDAQIDQLFKENEHWQKHSRPSDWGEPETVMANENFWLVFDICINQMSENIARVFTMREFLGFETAEICKQLQISDSNCWTLLHRARSRLRLCLETQWQNS